MCFIERRKIKIGTRKSKLALIQTSTVIEAIKSLEIAKDLDIEIVTTESFGDKVLDKPLPSIGGKGVFTEEIEKDLSAYKIDMAVHSMKDLPTTFSHDLLIGCILPRGDRRDAVVFRSPEYTNLNQLPPNSIVGTSSLRRRAYISKHYPHLRIDDVRGNLNTRFSKLFNDVKRYDALILAAAGIQRMGLEDSIGQYMDEDPFYYAVGQGIIAVQVRKDDDDILEMLRPFNCRVTVLESLAERVFLSCLKAGCSAPVGVRCTSWNDRLSLAGVVMSVDGSKQVEDSLEVIFGNDQECQHSADLSFTSIAKLCDIAEMTQVVSAASLLADSILCSGGANILAEINLN